MDQDVLHQGVFFALQMPVHVANPYPFYHKLRSKSAFYWDFVSSAWFITRYDDVRPGLLDSRFTTKNFPFDVSQLSSALRSDLAPLKRVANKEVLHSNASDHERLRRPLNRAFQPGAMEQSRPSLTKLAEQLLADAERSRAMEIVRDYCEPLADHLFGELLGLPPSHRNKVIRWCDDIRKFTMMPRCGRATNARARIAAKSFRSLQTYFKPVIAQRRKEFVDDVIGRSLAVQGNESQPSSDEVMANCVFFLHSGVRNMSACITNAIYVLLRNPAQFLTLRKDAQLAPTAVEELLRYDPPLQVVSRGVMQKGELAGREIRPGQLLVFLLGAANRDPTQFKNPDLLDFRRSPNRHLSFGVGAHGCVGAWIARFGLNVALAAILNRGTNLAFSPAGLKWNFPLIRRELFALPVKVKPRMPYRVRLASP